MGVALAWACVACAQAGGESTRVDQSAVAGEWSNAGGARLHLGADRAMTWSHLKSAMLGGTSCPETAAGHWQFFSPPNAHGSSFTDEALTRGDEISLDVDGSDSPCLLSALVRRDGKGLDLCLVEDPDSDCSDEELLRREPTPRRGRAAK
ncbi:MULTISPECIES: hypothetical protein [unclassified Streptomyces]|uniref:hypothetical protein n=1 Tax=unclassified Streptomyces TaxID=2593676 RepID=UPI0033C6DFF9